MLLNERYMRLKRPLIESVNDIFTSVSADNAFYEPYEIPEKAC
jgi:hypothetical protein